MQKIENVIDALAYLNDGEILTTNNIDQFILKDKNIHRYSEGNHFIINVNDYLSLYKNTPFYIYEDGAEIDDSKDEAYYRYYKK